MQVAYTCLMMVITLTVFAYLLGEISNVVMEADEELVKQRHQVGTKLRSPSDSKMSSHDYLLPLLDANPLLVLDTVV